MVSPSPHDRPTPPRIILPAAAPAGASRARSVVVVVGVAIGVGVIGFLVILLVAAYLRSQTTATKPSDFTRPTPAPTPPPDPAAELAKAMLAQTTFEGAIRVAKPQMADTSENPSPGAGLLVGWALQRPLRWTEVEPRQDETSVALVQKDSARERGKRLCAPGTIIEIRVQRTELGAYATGLLFTEAGNLIHFLAVRDTGELVSESSARFCGAVTGTLDYANSRGGVGHAVQMVGMFDLPTNRVGAKAP